MQSFPSNSSPAPHLKKLKINDAKQLIFFYMALQWQWGENWACSSVKFYHLNAPPCLFMLRKKIAGQFCDSKLSERIHSIMKRMAIVKLSNFKCQRVPSPPVSSEHRERTHRFYGQRGTYCRHHALREMRVHKCALKEVSLIGNIVFWKFMIVKTNLVRSAAAVDSINYLEKGFQTTYKWIIIHSQNIAFWFH